MVVKETVGEELAVEEEGLLDAFETVEETAEEYLLAVVGITVGKEDEVEPLEVVDNIVGEEDDDDEVVDGRTRVAESILIKRNAFSFRLETRKG